MNIISKFIESSTEELTKPYHVILRWRLISLDRVLLIYMSRALVQEWRDPANEWYDGYGSRRGIIYQSIEGMSSVYILAATPKLLMPCLF